jgi:hypothetical protein
MALVSRHKDDERSSLPAQRTDHAQPVELRHLQVEEHQIRFQLDNPRQRFGSGRSFTGHFKCWNRLNMLAQNLARDGFVVGDQNPQPAASTARAAPWSAGAGIVKETALPCVSDRISKWVSDP